ncbi:2Fe-2S iron-sulfur cluster-binding protein [Streptomyces sp. NPDC046909]|uniref:2Fe-2S iron-sulfur cluster-binding protein n=1 Tax=Streptomyces sp. NPDC046909 TaxID=3155617 RepID=UPI0033FF2C67
MTDDRHGEGTPPQSGGRWDPLPQGDYDDGATAFVKLPEGGIEALLASDSPLAAPGHGYVPPQITVAPGTDPSAASTGAWAVPADGVQWPDPNAVPQGGVPQAGDDRFTYNPAATGQWNFEEHVEHTERTDAVPAPGHDVTGQWSIPVAGGDLPDESGEFTTSSLVEQWGGTPPATLPGGAPAPWATQTQAGQPWATETPGAGQEHGGPVGDERGAVTRDDRGGVTGAGHAHVSPGDTHAHVPPRDDRRGPADAAHMPSGDGHGGPAGDGHHDPAPDAHARVETGTAYDPAQPHGHAPADPSPDIAPAASQATHGPGEASAATDTPEGAPEAVEAAETATEPHAGPDTEPHAEHAPADRDVEAGPEAAEEHADDPEAADEPAPVPTDEEHPLASYVLRVNGVERPVADAWIGESLLYVLRERLGLAGAKDGCSQGECGACNVQVDGRLVASCLVPAVTAAGSEVRTVEGLAEDGQPSDVQRALAKCGAVQCGFCVPGMAMTVHDLLEGNPAPTELETRQALCGNLCRCSGYRGVVDAVKEVVAQREAHAAADSESDADEARIPHQAGPGAGGVNPSAFEPPHDQAYGTDGGQA